MKNIILVAVAVFLTAGCAGMFGGKDEASSDFDQETRANEARVKEDRVRSSLAQLEARLADYTKAEKTIPAKLEKLVPKYIAGIPPLDLPVCGRESNRVEVYPPEILRDGQVDGSRIAGSVLVGADGANGITARHLDLGHAPTYGVALEGNLPYSKLGDLRYSGKAVLELATVPGGYGWVFPKGDHANFGVGGWEREGPALRAHLKALCRAHGVSDDALESLRGHRLPLRRPEARLARGRALLVGDAAGLVDPLSGDGMYEAFVSARLAAGATLDFLAGRAQGVEPYDTALRRTLARMTSASWGAKLAFDHFPRIAFTLSRPPFVWPVIAGLLQGELPHPGAARGLARAPLKVVEALSELVGSPGRRYRVEGV